VTRREQIIERELTQCRHFNGTRHGKCQAGIVYADQFPDAAMTLKCLPRLNPAGREAGDCPRFEIVSREEAEKAADEQLEYGEVFAVARKLAHEDGKCMGFGKGRGGGGKVVCPKCGKRLIYAVAAYNGHMHGQCETPGCISWME
jgi:hypothetical protein